MFIALLVKTRLESNLCSKVILVIYHSHKALARPLEEKGALNYPSWRGSRGECVGGGGGGGVRGRGMHCTIYKRKLFSKDVLVKLDHRGIVQCIRFHSNHSGTSDTFLIQKEKLQFSGFSVLFVKRLFINRVIKWSLSRANFLPVIQETPGLFSTQRTCPGFIASIYGLITYLH